MGINVNTPHHCTLRLVISLYIEYLEFLNWPFIGYLQPVPLKISIDHVVHVVLYTDFFLVQGSGFFSMTKS